jgi:hypothetical protein
MILAALTLQYVVDGVRAAWERRVAAPTDWRAHALI